MPPVDPELIALAREEAKAIVEEAEEQARMLIDAAEKEEERSVASAGPSDVNAAAEVLARHLERSIALLTQILEALRRQLG
jgi:hypothetical protein